MYIWFTNKPCGTISNNKKLKYLHFSLSGKQISDSVLECFFHVPQNKMWPYFGHILTSVGHIFLFWLQSHISKLEIIHHFYILGKIFSFLWSECPCTIFSRVCLVLGLVFKPHNLMDEFPNGRKPWKICQIKCFLSPKKHDMVKCTHK